MKSQILMFAKFRWMAVATAFFTFYGQVADAQFAQDWRFGFGSRIVFGATGPAVAAPGGVLFSEGGSVAITNATGQTLFYSNAQTVWNRNNAIMQNGSGLRGNEAATQAALAIPYPFRPNRHILFTLGLVTDTSTYGLNYHVIDMSLDGGLGGIVPSLKNVPLLAGAPTNLLTEKMCATRHCNGNDFWVVVHRLNSNEFVVYLVDSNGVQAPSFQQVGTPHNNAVAGNLLSARRGYMAFSPDGRKLALVTNGNTTNNLIEVFDFDKNTGIISNPLRLPAKGGEFGVAFSPDNAKLFVQGGTDTTIGLNIGSKNHLSVFNMIAADPASTKTPVIEQVISDSRRFRALQNGPDGRIYSVLSLMDALNSIPNPLTPPYGYEDSTVYTIGGGTTRLGLPNFVNDEFSLPFVANFSYNFACINQPMQFFDSSLSNARSWRWNFGDGSAGGNDTSSQRFPLWIYNNPGTYTVTLIAGAGCGVFDTIVKQVEVGIELPVNLGNDTAFFCGGDSARLASNITNGTFVWSTGQPGGPWTALPADTFPVLSTLTPGWYKLNVDNGSCQGADSVYVFFNNDPLVVDLGADFDLCIGTTEILDAGNPGATYLWSTGDSTRTISISQPDTFWVEVRYRGCIATDTIMVALDTISSITVMPDTTLCPGELLTINAGPFGNGFLWSTNETTAAISVEDTGTYIVRVTTANGCILFDTIQVRFRCDTKVYFPTAFTPNGDGLNDIFKPALQSVEGGFYELQVYDRWGRAVFTTNNPEVGWNGQINGADAPPGAYQYICRFNTNVFLVDTYQTGTFYLIR
jgi:gliding motility-associated-like protein